MNSHKESLGKIFHTVSMTLIALVFIFMSCMLCLIIANIVMTFVQPPEEAQQGQTWVIMGYIGAWIIVGLIGLLCLVYSFAYTSKHVVKSKLRTFQTKLMYATLIGTAVPFVLFLVVLMLSNIQK